MKIALTDHSKRVSRLIHRSTPGGELVILDLEAGYRGEIWCLGGEENKDEIFIQCRSTKGPRYRRDPADAQHLIVITYPRGKHGRRVFLDKCKGTMHFLLAPIHNWMPDAAAGWTEVTHRKETA